MDDCYRGVRWEDGKSEVSCPGGWFVLKKPSVPATWGDESFTSERLAFEIIWYHTSDHRRAMVLCGPFLRKVIAKITGDSWTLPSWLVDDAIREIDADATTANTTTIIVEPVPEVLHDHNDVVKDLG